MTDMPTEAPPTAAVRRLTRSSQDRWFGGVCGGLGRYFDISPAVYRLAFAALVLAGGTGILLYLAAWLVIPDEGEETSVAEGLLRNHRDRPVLTVALALLALVAAISLSHAVFWPHPGNLWLTALIVGGGLLWWELHGRRGRVQPPAPSADPAEATVAVPPPPRRRSLFGPVVGALIAAAGLLGLLAVLGVPLFDLRIALAGAVVLVGVAIAAGASTQSPIAGLFGLGILLVLALVVAVSVDVPLRGGVGERHVQPAALTAVDTHYRRSVGELTVDLRDTAIADGVHRVDATLGIGELRIRVPDGVDLDVRGRAQGGEVRLLGRRENGWDVDSRVREASAGSDATLVIDAHVGFGEVRVERG
jgi:phage shock protein PspC (stress-responsive transcriptional regulator)